LVLVHGCASWVRSGGSEVEGTEVVEHGARCPEVGGDEETVLADGQLDDPGDPASGLVVAVHRYSLVVDPAGCGVWAPRLWASGSTVRRWAIRLLFGGVDPPGRSG
jgi:hypothetical protein